LKIHTVPLRDRTEDISELLACPLSRYDMASGRSPLPLSSAVLSRMRAHSWPGNVRELDSLAQRYAALSMDHGGGESLLLEIMEELCSEAMPAQGEGGRIGSIKEQIRAYEQDLIAETLRQTGDNKAEAARILGMSVNTLWRKLREQ
jgi:DNA-binding NtrC family response regulator